MVDAGRNGAVLLALELIDAVAKVDFTVIGVLGDHVDAVAVLERALVGQDLFLLDTAEAADGDVVVDDVQRGLLAVAGVVGAAEITGVVALGYLDVVLVSLGVFQVSLYQFLFLSVVVAAPPIDRIRFQEIDLDWLLQYVLVLVYELGGLHDVEVQGGLVLEIFEPFLQ